MSDLCWRIGDFNVIYRSIIDLFVTDRVSDSLNSCRPTSFVQRLFLCEKPDCYCTVCCALPWSDLWPTYSMGFLILRLILGENQSTVLISIAILWEHFLSRSYSLLGGYWRKRSSDRVKTYLQSRRNCCFFNQKFKLQQQLLRAVVLSWDMLIDVNSAWLLFHRIAYDAITLTAPRTNGPLQRSRTDCLGLASSLDYKLMPVVYNIDVSVCSLKTGAKTNAGLMTSCSLRPNVSSSESTIIS